MAAQGPAEVVGIGADLPLRAEIAHTAGPRLRLRLTRAAERDRLEWLADRIADCAGVTRVVVRPNTRSVIVEGTVPAGTLAERIEAAGIVRLVPAGTPPPMGQAMQLGLLRLDMAIKARSKGAADLRSTIALVLLAASMVQTARGRVVGPASTLALGALSLIDRASPGK